MSVNKFYSLAIRDIRPETDEAVSITLDVPEPQAKKFRFIQGQYLTLRADIDNQSISRSYSICSGVEENELRIAIKKIDGGIFSTYATSRLKPGDMIDVMPPKGNFFTRLEPAAERNYLCIAAGSGITPVISIIKSILFVERQSRVTLIYGNRTSSSIMFREELGFIKNRYMERFNWINVLSREEQDAEVLYGRINNRKGAELHSKHLIDIATVDEFFLCGPESMISEVARGLRAEGVADANIHYELFFASAEDAREAIEKHHARAIQYAGQMSEVTVNIDGRSIRFDLPADGENILDGALDHGVDVPYSCKGGVCATCKAKLLEGEVEMDINHSLSEEEISRGMILTCQSHPLTKKVVLDFDY